MDPREVRGILRMLGIRPSRAEGQNFLLDERQARRQVEAAGLARDGTILEIGPGLGILTGVLAATGHRVVAIEADGRLLPWLRGRWPAVEFLQGDVLEVPWPTFDWCISNLPFSISSPILFRLLDHPLRGAILMVQREFARRLVAPVGSPDYSRLTVKTYYRAEAKLLWTVPPSAFWPQPRVSAAVVRLRPRPPPFAPRDEAAYLRLVDLLFRYRRKAVGTILAMVGDEGALPNDWKSRLPGPVLGARPGALSPEQLAKLSDALVAPEG